MNLTCHYLDKRSEFISPTSTRALPLLKDAVTSVVVVESRGVRREPGGPGKASIRSPQWRGGGVVFGPKPRDLSLDLPTKMKRAALKLALSAKVEDVVVVDQFKLKDAKTKQVATSLKKLNLPGKTLFVLAERQEDLVRAGRNIPGLKIEIAKDLNALEVISARKLVFAKDSLAQFEGKDAA